MCICCLSFLWLSTFSVTSTSAFMSQSRLSKSTQNTTSIQQRSGEKRTSIKADKWSATYTGAVGLGVGVESSLTAAGAPPADKDEGPGKCEHSDSTDHDHHALHQWCVLRRQVDVKLTMLHHHHHCRTPPPSPSSSSSSSSSSSTAK